MSKFKLAVSALCLAAASSGLHAQDVFVLPGSTSPGANVFVYSAQPLSNVTGFPAGIGAFQALAKPDGTAFYVIANSKAQGVTVTGSTFATAQAAGSFTQAPTAAVLTPDGRKLLVAAGTLHVIDTGTNSELVAGGVNVSVGANVIDVTTSLDGKSFFALSNLSSGSQLNSIDPTSYQVTGTLSILGTATTVTAGPNGLIYVATQNEIIEVNPTTMQPTTNGVIALNALPGRLVFTPDGQYLLAPNQTPATGSAVLLVSLTNHNIANFVPNFGVLIDRLAVVNATTIIGYSSQIRSLYQFTLSGANIIPSGFSLPNVTTNVTAFTLSDEVGGSVVSTPKSLYAISGGTLYQYNFGTASIGGQFIISDSNSTGAVSYAAPVSTGNSPVAFLTFGGNQTVAPSGVSLPIVFEALDSTGRPVSGASVSFTSNAGGTLTPSSVTTGANGFAVTYFTAPAVGGPVVITASSGTLSATANVTVGTVSTGGGPSGANITILSGQGQVLPQNFSTVTTNSPLLVQVSDGSGNPVAGASVTFAVNQGNGSLQVNSSYSSTTVPGPTNNSFTVTSDANGKAAVDFQALSIVQGSGFQQTSVLVNAPGTATLTFYVTTVSTGGFNQTPAPTAYLIAPQPGAVLSGQAGTVLPGAVVVRISSGSGTPIPNVGVVLSNGGLDPKAFPSGMCNVQGGGTLLTDANGNASCDLKLGPVLGTATITPVVGVSMTTPSFVIQVAAGPPGIVKVVQGNNQSGNPGQLLNQALVVQVTDSSGNILTGTPVSWQVVTAGTVTLSNVITSTDSNGRASALATLGSVAGAALVKVTAGSVSATFTLTVNVAAAGLQKVSGDAQSALINTGYASPIVVKVVDKNGAPVNAVTVTFAITSGSGSLGTTSVTTGANGQASTTVTAGSTSGSLVISASTSGFAVSFTLTVTLPGPANITFVNGASFQSGIAPGSIALITGSSIAPNVQGLIMGFNILGPLPTSLAGVSITFNGVAAPIYYISNSGGQQTVAVQVPFETQPGSVSVVINAAGGGSGTFNTQIQVIAPAVFTSGNQSLAVVVRSDGSYVSAGNPAQRGEIVQLYLTGLGPVSPTAGTGAAGIPGQAITSQLLIGLNNAGVPFLSANYAPGLVGVYVVTFQIPSSTQPGPSQPVGVLEFDSSNNQYFAPSTYIPIS